MRAPHWKFWRRCSRRLACSKAQMLPRFSLLTKPDQPAECEQEVLLLGRVCAAFTTQPSGAPGASCRLPSVLFKFKPNPTPGTHALLSIMMINSCFHFCACDLNAGLGKVIAFDIDAMLFTPLWSVKLTSSRLRQ